MIKWWWGTFAVTRANAIYRSYVKTRSPPPMGEQHNYKGGIFEFHYVQDKMQLAAAGIGNYESATAFKLWHSLDSGDSTRCPTRRTRKPGDLA